MIRVLVPIDAFSHLTLSATYFALEFAKRNPAKVFFLILEAPDEKTSGMERTSTGNAQWQTLFKQLLQRGREQQVNLEIHHSREDYLTAISRLAEQHNIDDIIIAVPPVVDETHTQIQAPHRTFAASGAVPHHHGKTKGGWQDVGFVGEKRNYFLICEFFRLKFNV